MIRARRLSRVAGLVEALTFSRAEIPDRGQNLVSLILLCAGLYKNGRAEYLLSSKARRFEKVKCYVLKLYHRVSAVNWIDTI